MQHRIVNCKFKFAVFAGICQKNMFMISKKQSIKITEYAEKMQYRHPPIQEHLVYLHLTCMYMYIYVIYTAHIYICVYNAVTILFNQHFIIVENIVGQFRTGILNLFI